MYAVSTFVMNHRTLFHPETPAPPRFEVERTLSYPGEMADRATAEQSVQQVLAALDLDGAHAVNRSSTSERVVLIRQHATAPRRITYTAGDNRIVVEKMVFSGTRFLEQMHRRRGYQYDYLLDDLWAVSVDLTIAALVLLAFSGIWMWWELRITRRLGAIALSAGCLLFALFLAVL